jgi:hypothetical protein
VVPKVADRVRKRAARVGGCGQCNPPAWLQQRGEAEQFGGLEQRQPHDARVAAVDALDEHRAEALDGIAAGLVAGSPVAQ